MTSKRPQWELYNDGMSEFNSGHALWEPSPDTDYKRIQPADVGYIRTGCFNFLFSAGLPLGERERGTDVPQTFKQLVVGKIIQRAPLPAGALCTNGVRATRLLLSPSQSPSSQSPTSTSLPSLSPPYVRSIASVTFRTSDPNFRMMGSASCISFRLTGGHGAALLTKHSTYREDIQRTGAFEKYAKEHYDSWVTFARDTGHGDVNPVIVTGVDRTRDFAMLCYSNDDDDLRCEFTTSAPGVADWGAWHKTGLVHTNHGPQLRSPPSSTQAADLASSGGDNTGSVSDEYNQCVFIRYYTVRKRLGIPRIIKAAAGPHVLSRGGCDDDESLIETRCDSEQGSGSDSDSGAAPSLFDDDSGNSRRSIVSTDTESDIVTHNTTADGRDDFDVLADFVFQNSDALSVLLHHRDIVLLRGLGGDADLLSQLLERRLQITVDENGVGMIGPQTGFSAGTSCSGTTAVQNIETQHGITLPPAPSLSLVPRDLEPEVEGHSNEIHNVGSLIPLASQDQNELQRLGNPILPGPGREQQQLSHEPYKPHNQYHVIPDSTRGTASPSRSPQESSISQPVTQQQTTLPCRKNTPANPGIKITPPDNLSTVVAAEGDSPSSLPSPTKPRSVQNVKRLSLSLQTNPSPNHPTVTTQDQRPIPPSPVLEPRRRSSFPSLPAATTILEEREDDSPSVPYVDGPIEVLPGIWLGSEDSARDWRGLVKRGIKSILNVAKEVACPMDASASRPLRSSVSTSDLSVELQDSKPIYFPAHIPSGRPGFHYLKLPWSHGQPDLAKVGLPAAFNFVDKSAARGDGVLIHCQCGISRSGALVIALVMRAAAKCTMAVPPEVWALEGMQSAFSYVKGKSKWVGPNMSLIHQLLDYERVLKSGGNDLPDFSARSPIVATQEEEWGHRRSTLDNDPSDADVEGDPGVTEVAHEARALDKATEDRVLGRKSSWRLFQATPTPKPEEAEEDDDCCRRHHSITSNYTSRTNRSDPFSEHLIGAEEEEELLNVGGGFDDCGESIETSADSQYEEYDEDNVNSLPVTPHTASLVQRYLSSITISIRDFPQMLSSLTLPTFDVPPLPRARLPMKGRRCPPPLSTLPTAHSSLVIFGVVKSDPAQTIKNHIEPRISAPASPGPLIPLQPLPTPSRTLFVFPPSHSPNALPSAASSTKILTFPSMKTPRLSSRGSRGRPSSLIFSATPTTALSCVDVRGWVGTK